MSEETQAEATNNLAAAVHQLAASIEKGLLTIAAAMVRSASQQASAAGHAGSSAKGPRLTVSGPIESIRMVKDFMRVTVGGLELSTKKTAFKNDIERIDNAGHSVELTYTESQNGQWTNRYIESIKILGGGSAARAVAKGREPGDDDDCPV